MHRKLYIYSLVLFLAIISNIYYYHNFLVESYMRYALKDEYIVVSLSTTPNRIDKIAPILETLIKQNAPIKAIYLNIPYVFKRDNTSYEIPDWILSNSKISILRPNDYGPATKLLGALEKAALPNNAIIITVDDDVYYPKNLVLQLAYKAKKYPDRAIGIIGANPAPESELGIVKIKQSDAMVSILQGYAGVAYRRSFFDNSIFKILDATKDCINSDDIYISSYLARQGIKRQVLKNDYINSCSIRWQTDIGTNEYSLHMLTPKPAEKHKNCISFLSKHYAQVVF